ncbi:MAG: matrixin family metalloprotease [Bdellovibrionota bacterium]
MFVRLFLGLAMLTASSQAYVRTMSSTGRALYWPNPSVTMQGNPTNSSGLSQAQVSSMLGDSFASWQLSGTRVGLGYSQSTGNPTHSGIDGLNAVYFASAGGRNMDWGVVALTEVLYYVSNGQITEADMVFNDNQFLFTNNAGDTGSSINGRTAIYLRDVATHEAGHVLGLDHSLVNLSSLIFTAFNGQYSLSGDDANGIRTMYPSGASSGGAMSGVVAGTNGGIFGAHLTAVNLLTGKVEAGILASSNGSFRLGDVPAGRYAVMMEPFGTDVSSVSSYYQNVNHRFCSYNNFRRRFYSDCNGTGAVSVMGVSAGSSTSLGTLAPSCSQMGNPGGEPTSIAAAKVISNQGGAAFGTLTPGAVHYYIVHNVSGSLSARVMSYSLYSPVDVKVNILDSNGNAVAGSTSTDNVDAPGPGGVVNYDSLATANVASGDYVIQITSGASALSGTKYSAGFDLLDNDGHYLVALAVNGDINPTSLTDMSSCVSVNNVPQSASYQDYVAPAQKQKSAGCGSLSAGGGGPFFGGMMQVLTVASALQLLSMAIRNRRQRVLARHRR